MGELLTAAKVFSWATNVSGHAADQSLVLNSVTTSSVLATALNSIDIDAITPRAKT